MSPSKPDGQVWQQQKPKTAVKQCNDSVWPTDNMKVKYHANKDYMNVGDVARWQATWWNILFVAVRSSAPLTAGYQTLHVHFPFCQVCTRQYTKPECSRTEVSCSELLHPIILFISMCISQYEHAVIDSTLTVCFNSPQLFSALKCKEVLLLRKQ